MGQALRSSRQRTASGSLPRGVVLSQRWPLLRSQAATSLGLDFGAGSLKLAQVRWGRSGPVLESFAVVPVTPGAAGEAGIGKEREIAGLLELVIRSLRLRQRRTGLVLGGPGILMRYLTLPAMSEAELRYAVRFEASQYLPIPEDQLVYDFAAVPGAGGVPENQMAVFLAGSRRSFVQSYTNTLARAGLRTQAAELDCLALGRTLETLGLIPPNSPEPFALLDVGEGGTRISIFRYGVPMFTRTLPQGLSGLRQSALEVLQSSWDEAEAGLRSGGFGLESPLWSTAERWLRAMAEAVQRSIEFFLIQHRSLRIRHVYACGGGALLPGFAQALHSELAEGMGHGEVGGEAPAVRVVDLGGLALAPGAREAAGLGAILAAAVGSALRGGPV